MKRTRSWQVILLAVLVWMWTGAALAAETPETQSIRKRRVDALLPEALSTHGIDCWLVFTRESSRDPIAEDVAGGRVVARAAFIFARTPQGFRKVAIVASYDVTPVKESGIYDEVIAYRGEGIKEHLQKVMAALNPRRIGIDFSRDVPTADGLTLGMRNYLEETLGAEMAGRFVSAQPVVVSFRGGRPPEEGARLREAAGYTDKIMREALSEKVITPGKTTEKDVADYLQRRTEEFGARGAFASGVVWAPCRQATAAAIAAMKPGVTGNDVDTVARKVLTDAGYAGYPHAAGHPIGFDVHDVGPLLGPDWKERYGSTVWLKLEKDQTFAVEPILYAEYAPMCGEINIGIEEDVVVTAAGVERLHPRQDALLLIRAAK